MTTHIQHCFGDYEKVFCNGDPEAEDIYDSLPCNRRDVCEAFQLYLKEIDKERIDYFEIESGEDENGEEFFYAAVADGENFLEFCGKLVERYGTHAETIKKHRFAVVDKPSHKKRKGWKHWKQQREARSKRIKNDRCKVFRSAVEQFRAELSAKLPVGTRIADDGVLPLPGELFVVNRAGTKFGGDVSIYMKGYASKDLEVVRLVPRWAKRKFFATFCFEKEYVEDSIGEKLTDFLNLEQSKNKKFCRTKLLDNVGMSLLTEAVARFFDNGLIPVFTGGG